MPHSINIGAGKIVLRTKDALRLVERLLANNEFYSFISMCAEVYSEHGELKLNDNQKGPNEMQILAAILKDLKKKDEKDNDIANSIKILAESLQEMKGQISNLSQVSTTSLQEVAIAREPQQIQQSVSFTQPVSKTSDQTSYGFGDENEFDDNDTAYQQHEGVKDFFSLDDDENSGTSEVIEVESEKPRKKRSLADIRAINDRLSGK